MAPRSRHGEWGPASDRPDPVELLEEQAATRVPELVPIRDGRMLVSPFTFFRGAAYPMAADLATAPRTGLGVQLCGDAHCPTSGGSPRPTGGWRSASTTSTRRCRARSSGTSSGWRQVSPSPVGTDASTTNSARRSTWPSRVRTVGRSGRSRRCPPSTCGTPAFTWTRPRRWRLGRGPQTAEAVRPQLGQGTHQRQPESVREADDARGRPTSHRSDPPLIVPTAEVVRGGPGRARALPTGGHPLLPPHPDR